MRNFLTTISAILFSVGLFGQSCAIVFKSPDVVNFPATGSTIDVQIEYNTTASCDLGLTNMPAWASFVIVNRNLLRLTALSNSGASREQTINLVLNSGFQTTLLLKQTANSNFPGDPNDPTANISCGQAVLQRNPATPPNGETWYWQGRTVNGTSTSKGSGLTYTANEGDGWYYIRAFKNGNWSTNSGSVFVAVPQKPATPATPTVGILCGRAVLQRAAPPTGVAWYWQTTPSGTSTLDANPSFTASASGTMYLRAKQGDCWSDLSASVTFTATDGPQAPNPVPNQGCGGTSAPISAQSLPSETITLHNWYNVPSGGTPISGVAQNTAPASGYYISTLTKTFTATETYYVAAVCNGEESAQRTTVSYTVISSPQISISVAGGAQPQYCGGSVTLQAGGGSNYAWRRDSPSGTVLGTLATYVATVAGTYYLTGTRTCGAQQTQSIGIVFANLAAPTLQSIVEDCGSTVVTRNAPPGGQVWHWQTAPDGTDTSAASTQQARTVSGTGPLYLRARAEFTDCWGPVLQVSYGFKPIPVAATGSDVENCGAGPVVLTAAPGTNADGIRWYGTATGGAPLGTGTSYTTGALSTTTSFYAEAYSTVTQCTATSRTEVRAIVHPGAVTSAPAGPNMPFCAGGQVTLTVTLPDNADGARWYDLPDAQVPIATGTSYTTPLLGQTTTYYVEGYNTVTGCTSPFRKSIQAQLLPEVVWYLDADGDGLGDPAAPGVQSCAQPQGYVGNSGDECPEVFSSTNNCSFDPTDQNHVYSRTYQVPSATVLDPQFFTQNDALLQQITYFDGLGRPVQQNAIGASPSRADVLTHISYDGFGRQDKDWLPVPEPVGGPGSYRTTDLEAAAKAYYHGNFGDDFNGVPVADNNPYSQKRFEASPLNRVLQQAAPGADWKLGNGHEIGFGYMANTVADSVRLFTVGLAFADNTYSPTLLDGGGNTYYAAGELYKTITYDENHASVGTPPLGEPEGADKLHSTEEFTDKQGRVVLKRTYASVGTPPSGAPEAYDTYYVYDDFGNPTYVLPPKVGTPDGISATELAELCYQYVYDHRNRVVEKKIPGKGWEHIVYNKLDQPIMTQDANQRFANEWLFTKYDAFGRVAYTGKAVDGRGRIAIQAEANGLATALWVERTGAPLSFGGAQVHYGNTAYPTATVTEVLTINYYDNYVFDLAGGTDPGTVFGQAIASNVKGLPTGTKVKVLDVSPAKWVTSVTYYDDKGRPIHTYSNNEYLGTTDIVASKLDFVGRPEKVRASHIRTLSGVEGTITTLDDFAYDHAGRLLAQTQCMGDETMGDSCPASGTIQENVAVSGTISGLTEASNSITVTSATLLPGAHLRISNGSVQELIVYNDYDELGQLRAKKVGGPVAPAGDYQNTVGLQTVGYAYNVRGWLTKINDVTEAVPTKLFNFSLGYNTGASPLYNGNIAQTQWRTANTDSSLKSYQFAYDPLNRITAATDNTGNYNLSNVTYDKNGNIMALNRKGHTNAGATSFGDMDILGYTYDSGNKLMKVADAAPLDQFGFKDDAVNQAADTADDYAYDTNGNMTSDANKGITGIVYNHLNLPTQVTMAGQNISYIYDAVGAKLRKTVSGITTDYAGNYIYENGTLQFFNHAEGYVEPNGTGWQYVYQYKDHVNNVRLSYSDLDGNGSINPSTEILHERNYYPFGLQHKGYNNVVNGRDHKYQTFQGVEHEEALGLNIYEMDFRQYDPALGRFNVLDPLGEKRNWLTPYNFVQNNPILRIDPSGLLDDYGIDIDGNVSLIRRTNDNTDSLYFINKDWDIVEDNIEDIPNKGSVTVSKNKDGTSVLSQLATNSEAETIQYSDGATSQRKVSTAVSGNESDIFSVFKFAADNTNVEFSVQKFGSNGEVNYQLGTFHESNISPGLRNEGIPLGAVHSHPNIAIRSEAGVPNNADRLNSTAGDRDRATNYLNNNGKNLPYLIYFPGNGSTSRIRLPKEDFLNGSHIRINNNIGSFKL